MARSSRIDEQFNQYPHFEGQKYVDTCAAIPTGISAGQDALREAILELNKVASKDIHWYIVRGYQPSTISKCTALQIQKRTYYLICQLNDRNLTPDQKLQCVDQYERDCYRIARRHNIIKAVAVVAAAAAGFVIGAVLGATIGILAGLWSGPGAAVTAMFGFAMGAAIGVMAVAAAFGATTGGLAAFSLFKTNRVMKAHVSEVKEAARNLPGMEFRQRKAKV